MTAAMSLFPPSEPGSKSGAYIVAEVVPGIGTLVTRCHTGWSSFGSLPDSCSGGWKARVRCSRFVGF